jgi:hypothetical protein
MSEIQTSTTTEAQEKPCALSPERVAELLEKIREIANDVHEAWAEIPDPDDSKITDQKSADAFAADIRYVSFELRKHGNALDDIAGELEDEGDAA